MLRGADQVLLVLIVLVLLKPMLRPIHWIDLLVITHVLCNYRLNLNRRSKSVYSRIESLTHENIADINYTNWERVYCRKITVLEENTAFQVSCNRTKVDQHRFADVLKPGDHVTWRIKYSYWHHGIVSHINREKKTIGLIHWKQIKEERRFKIVEDNMKGKKPLYRKDYPDFVNNENPPKVVLKRARRSIGDTGYNVLSDNCETFASFCKSGVAKSHQIAWLKWKMIEVTSLTIVFGIMSTFTGIMQYLTLISDSTLHVPCLVSELPWITERLTPLKTIEHIVQVSKWIGAFLVIGIETTFVACALRKAYKERRNGKIPRNDFREIVIQRIFEGFLCSVLVLICCYFRTLVGPLGIFIEGIFGEIVSVVVGKVAGTTLGNMFGVVISRMISIALWARFPNTRPRMSSKR